MEIGKTGLLDESSSSKKSTRKYHIVLAAVALITFGIAVAALVVSSNNKQNNVSAQSVPSQAVYVIPARDLTVEGATYDHISGEFLFGSIAQKKLLAFKPGKTAQLSTLVDTSFSNAGVISIQRMEDMTYGLHSRISTTNMEEY
jgi:hypothetical protein